MGYNYTNLVNTTVDVRIVRETSTTEPVTIEEAKNYLRINNVQDDALIASMIKSSRRDAEQFINSDIIPKERILYYNRLDDEINLMYAPVASVDRVVVGGTVQTLNSGYELIGLDDPKFKLLNPGVEDIQIEYTTAGRDFDDLKIGILALMAFKYHGRDGEMSTNYKSWLNPYKYHGFYGVR